MKSLTKTIAVGTALHAHKCRFNKDHIIAKGDKRLQVKEGRSQMNYCVQCAKKAVRAGIDKLTSLLSEL
jgi:hypothetical protein